MKDNICIPQNIKMNILFNKLITIVLGIAGIGALIGIQTYFADVLKEGSEQVLLNALPIAYVLIATFIIIYPAFLIIANIDNRKIIKNMKLYGITEKMLYHDYMNALKHGKTRVGNLCTYSSDFYHYYVIPNARILYVNKKIKTRTYRKVKEYRNGAIQEVKYNIATRYMYFVRIMDIDGKSFLVSCNKEETADKLVNVFAKHEHILIGDINNTTFRKKLKQARIEAKKKEKEKCKNPHDQLLPPEFEGQ